MEGIGPSRNNSSLTNCLGRMAMASKLSSHDINYYKHFLCHALFRDARLHFPSCSACAFFRSKGRCRPCRFDAFRHLDDNHLPIARSLDFNVILASSRFLNILFIVPGSVLCERISLTEAPKSCSVSRIAGLFSFEIEIIVI